MNVDFVPFIRGVRVLCKPRLIFSRINGPIDTGKGGSKMVWFDDVFGGDCTGFSC